MTDTNRFNELEAYFNGRLEDEMNTAMAEIAVDKAKLLEFLCEVRALRAFAAARRMPPK